MSTRTLFFRQFATSVRAGLSVERALTMQASRSHGKMRQALELALSRVHKGATLHDALKTACQRYQVFATSDLTLIHIGERSGKLAEHLDYLASYLENNQKLLQHLLSQLAYPAFLLIAGIMIAPAGLLFKAGTGAYLAAVVPSLLGLALLIGVPYALRGHRGFKERVLGFARHVPLLGGVLRKSALHRFATMLALAYQGGVDLVTAFRLAGEASIDPRIRRAATFATVVIDQGKGALVALERYPESFPETFRQYYQTGEVTGDLDGMMLKQAEMLEGEIQAGQKVFAKMVGIVAYLWVAASIAMRILEQAKGMAESF